MLIPDWLGDSDATALHYPFHLSWFALVERAQLEPGETLLVHAGAGGVGSAAIQLGKAVGARVIATAGGPEKVAFCKELGADVAIDYTRRRLRRRGRRGHLRGRRRRRPRHGRWLGHDGDLPVHGHARADPARRLRRGHHQRRRPAQPGPGDLRQLLAARRLPRLRRRPARHPHAIGLNWPSRSEGVETHQRLLAHAPDGDIRTVVTSEVPFDDLPEAMERQERRETMGRTVIQVG